MDPGCSLSHKVNLNMIFYIVSVILTIYGTHNIILQVNIITYHISLYNSSNKKTWDILLPIHNYLISDIIQGKKTFVPITIVCNLLSMFVSMCYGVFPLYYYMVLMGKVPPVHNHTPYGFYLVSFLNYKQQHVSINTSTSYSRVRSIGSNLIPSFPPSCLEYLKYI